MPRGELHSLAREVFPTSALYDRLRQRAVQELANALWCGGLAMRELEANAAETIWRDLLDGDLSGIGTERSADAAAALLETAARSCRNLAEAIRDIRTERELAELESAALDQSRQQVAAVG